MGKIKNSTGKGFIVDDDFISMLEGRDLRINLDMSGLFGGTRKTKEYGSSAEFADYREYVNGDDPRKIDTNLYARLHKLYLKMTYDERQLHHRIYIDSSASMKWGNPQKREIALKLACALAYLSTSAADRVSLYEMNGSACRELGRTLVGREAFYEAASELNGIGFSGSCNMEEAIKTANTESKLGKNDGVSFIISDLLSDCNYKGAVDLLRSHGREVCVIQVLSKDEITPGIYGKLVLIDSEAESPDDERNYKSFISKRRLKAYEETMSWYINDIKEFCTSRNAGYYTVMNDDKIEKILFEKMAEGGNIV